MPSISSLVDGEGGKQGKAESGIFKSPKPEFGIQYLPADRFKSLYFLSFKPQDIIRDVK